MRIQNKAPKTKDEPTPVAPDAVESVYSSIMTRVIRDVLGGEQAIGLVQEINSQHPRLFCFFDRDEPVRVNDIQPDEIAPDEQEKLVQDQDELEEENSHDLSHGLGDQPSLSGDKKIKRNSNSLIKENTNPLEKGDANSKKGLTTDEKGLGAGKPEKQALGTKGNLNLNKSLHLNDQKPQDSSRTQLIQNVPTHLSPNDFDDQNVSLNSPKKFHSVDIEAQTRPGDDLSQVIIRDEFKSAAQNILDEAFLAIIKEAISGKANLNERETHRSGTMRSVPLHQLRSQMSIRPDHPTNSQSNIRT